MNAVPLAASSRTRCPPPAKSIERRDPRGLAGAHARNHPPPVLRRAAADGLRLLRPLHRSTVRIDIERGLPRLREELDHRRGATWRRTRAGRAAGGQR